MKLNELAVSQPTRQIAKVFESYFGGRVQFDTLSRKQASAMLTRIRSLVREHRRTPEFHHSEQNPAYLKLVMMEQALTARVAETMAAPGTIAANPQAQAALQTAQMAQKKRQAQDQIKANNDQIKQLQAQNQELQQAMNMPTMAESRRRISESEVQQAQVVLASQDMVDQVQKMIEQVTAMQFKDLPALVDQVKTQMGPDQAMTFNQEATAALTGLTQNLQGSKTQLEAALGVVTGQAPQVPGDAGGTGMPGDAGLPGEEFPAPEGDGLDAEFDANLEEPEPEVEPAATTLGRGRR